MCRKEIERSEREIKKDQDIIAQYKAICQNYQNKYETERERAGKDLSQMTEKVKSCSDCSAFITELQNAAASPGSDSMTSSIDVETDKSGKDSHGRRITDLEAELIRTKVALAEAENRNGVRLQAVLVCGISNNDVFFSDASFWRANCTAPVLSST